MGCINWMLCRLQDFPEDSWVVFAKLAGREKIFIEDWEKEYYQEFVTVRSQAPTLTSWGRFSEIEVNGTSRFYYWDDFGWCKACDGGESGPPIETETDGGLSGEDWSQPPTMGEQYGWSVFKALCSILMLGFEGPPMTNTQCNNLASDWCKIEHIITLTCLWIGALFYAFIVSTITTILASLNVSRGRYEEKIMRAQEYMRHRKIPVDLRDKVRDFYAIRYPEGRVLEEDAILDELPRPLKEELLRHAARDLIQLVPLLSSSPVHLTHKMAAAIVPVVSFPEEVLYQEGHYGDSMFFIHSGMVQIYSQYIDQVYHTIGDGCYFGDVAIMCHTRRTATCKAAMHCILYELKAEQLFKVIADFPEVSEKYKSLFNPNLTPI